MLYNCDNYLCNAFFAANKKNIMLKEILTNIPEYISQYTDNIFQKFDISLPKTIVLSQYIGTNILFLVDSNLVK